MDSIFPDAAPRQRAGALPKGSGAGNPLLPEEKRLRGPDASFPALGKSLTKSAKISEKQR